NLVIVGSQVPDRVQLPDPMGYVQAFDARTGKRVWAFSTIPQSATDPGANTWENESWRRNGHANVWAPMALDEQRGLLYLPTSTPTSDYYGGNRPGANLFAESLVYPDAAQPRDDHRRRQTHRRGCAGHQAWRHIRLRSRDRHAGLADCRACGTH